MSKVVFVCVIPGRVAIKKNSKKLIRVGGRPRLVSSDKYMQWARAAGAFIKQAWRGRSTIAEPVNMKALYFFRNHAHEPDLSNCHQGLEDLLESLGVIANDKLIHGHDGSRKIFGEEPRIELELTLMEKIA